LTDSPRARAPSPPPAAGRCTGGPGHIGHGPDGKVGRFHRTLTDESTSAAAYELPAATRPRITPRIAGRGVAHGSGLGTQRWVVERGFAWLHAFKRLRTRYERRADIHLGLLQLACALICYRHLPSF
jgi:transposase